MPTYNLFSKRQKELSAEATDILLYDELNQSLRTQIIHIITDGMGKYGEGRYINSYAQEAYQYICDILRREYGLFELNNSRTSEGEIHNFILMEKSIEKVLDAVELCLNYIDKTIPETEHEYYGEVKLNGKEVIDELNQRFKEHAVGYQYEVDRMVKMDSMYIHSEIVKPALQLLFNPKFLGANEEYLKAHEHYRHGRNKECLAECLKAFESTMKIICTEKGWTFNTTDTAKPLVNVVLTNNLIPSYMQTQISAFKNLLESGIPTIRNKVGGHGQGATPTTADDETTRYALNLTGSNIIYLIELSNL
ncbi:MAG: hypothetical protein AAGC65_12475 [Mucilaginibacter sp.]|uniref:STM4504/CBY_0614 family protein n=1 Tax=Mucilaginibacter sp. TaxID=1882438 RepID=UPI0031A6450F